MTKVFWTEPLTITELPKYPMGIAVRFEANKYGITGDGAASERWGRFKVGDKVRLFMSFGWISDAVKQA